MLGDTQLHLDIVKIKNNNKKYIKANINDYYLLINTFIVVKLKIYALIIKIYIFKFMSLVLF